MKGRYDRGGHRQGRLARGVTGCGAVMVMLASPDDVMMQRMNAGMARSEPSPTGPDAKGIHTLKS